MQAPERLRPEDPKVKASPSFTVKPYLDKKKEEDLIPRTMKTLLIYIDHLIFNIGFSFFKTFSKEYNQICSQNLMCNEAFFVIMFGDDLRV